MGKVRVSHRGRLYLDFRFNGERYREGTGLKDSKENRATCERHLKLIEAEIAAGVFDYPKRFPHGNKIRSFVAPVPAAQTFREYAKNWLAENAPPNGLAPSTYSDYVSTLNAHLYPAIGDLPLSEISEGMLKSFRQRLAGLSPKRINNIFVPLKTIFKQARRRSEIVLDPTEFISPLKVGRSDIHPFSIEEINKILGALSGMWQAFFAVAFFTGMRTGELIALRWSDVDLPGGVIRVRKSITRGVEGLPKTERSQRDISMLPQVREALSGLPRASEWVFPNGARNPHNADGVRNRIWQPTLEASGLFEEIPNPEKPGVKKKKFRTLYQTRHTYASLMLLAGEDRLWVADQMGTSLEMLSKTYARYIKTPTRRDGAAFLKMYEATVAQTSEAKG